MTGPVDHEAIPCDRAAVAAMVERLHVLKAQRLAAEAAAQTAGEVAPTPASVSSAPTPTTTAGREGDVPRQRRCAIPTELVMPQAAGQQLGLFDE